MLLRLPGKVLAIPSKVWPKRSREWGVPGKFFGVPSLESRDQGADAEVGVPVNTGQPESRGRVVGQAERLVRS